MATFLLIRDTARHNFDVVVGAPYRDAHSLNGSRICAVGMVNEGTMHLPMLGLDLGQPGIAQI